MDEKADPKVANNTPNQSERRRQLFKSFEAKSLRSRSFLTQIADDLTNIFGSTSFLFLNAIVFFFWIILNLGWVETIEPWDPFPFGLLTMFVSLEAIFLAIFVLVAQNRSAAVSAIREEVHLRVNLIAEEEITKVLEVLAEIRKEVGIKKDDPELEMMLQRIDTNYIERSIVEQVSRANKSLSSQLANEFPEFLTYPIMKPIEVIQNMKNDGSSKKD